MGNQTSGAGSLAEGAGFVPVRGAGLVARLQGEINQGVLGSLLKTSTKDPGEWRLFFIRSRRLVCVGRELSLGLGFFVFLSSLLNCPPPKKSV